MEVRDEVKRFSQIMEQKLQMNDHKGGWDDMSVKDLVNRLCQEVLELDRAITMGEDKKNIVFESADVANFAMMVASKFNSG